MEELNMYENINEYGGTPGSAAPADVPLDRRVTISPK